MKTVKFFKIIAGVFFLSQWCGAAEKPDILFIFADDMSYEVLSGPRAEEVATPNLDRLMKTGTTFTHAYNSGAWNGAVCVASRAMLLSGRQLWHAQRDEDRFDADFVAKGRFWPQLLEKAGYETYMTGKWHVNADVKKAFNHVKNPRPGMPSTVETAYNRPVQGEPDLWRSDDPKNGGFWQGGKHWSEVEADTAISFLEAAFQEKKPYFLYLAFNAPHDPRQAPREFLDQYPPEKIALPENFLSAYPYREEMGAPHSLRDEKLAPMPRTPFSVKAHRSEYYALISHLDAQIGRVLDELEKSARQKNTYIVFTADHGLAVGSHGLMGKQNMYEHSVRVPFIVVGPGVAAGAKIDAPIYLQDVMPSTLDWARLEKPDWVEFQSVQGLLDGTQKGREAIYGAFLDKQRQITKDHHKLILYPKAKVARLYDLQQDPWEKVDLLEAKPKEFRTKANELFAAFSDLKKETGDEMTYDSADYPVLHE